jgi:type VI secretion system protein ImpK
MQNDDKTIILYPSNDSENSTQINTDFSSHDLLHQQEILPRIHEDLLTSSLSTHQSQPFLSILRSLYREVYHLERGETAVDIMTLKRTLIQTMDKHTQQLAEQGYENTHIMLVRYILATYIDEQLGKITWHDGETWANHSLLGYYYKETYGGEKFFKLLDQFAKEPSKYMQHMKLIYACLSLGYKGKYSMVENSQAQLETMRQELYAHIKNFDTPKEKFYNDHPASRKKHKMILHVPYKLFIAGTFLIMGIVYAIFSSMVSNNEEQLMQTLEGASIMIEKDNNESD